MEIPSIFTSGECISSFPAAPPSLPSQAWARPARPAQPAPPLLSPEGGLFHISHLRRCFDSVSREGLWLTLRRQGVPPRLLAVARALHVGMEARVRGGAALSEAFPVRTGVRLGCVVAPALLNIFYGAVLDEWRRRAPPDVVFRFAVDAKLSTGGARGGRSFRPGDRASISDVTYADDSCVAASSWESAQRRW